jgi:anti-sigma B factor antagonist
MSMQLRIETSVEGDVGVIVATGEIDMATAGALRQAVTDLLAGGFTHLVVDMRPVAFLDSTGLGVLVGARKKVLHTGGSLALVCDTPRLLRLFRITGIDQALPIHPDVDAALAAVPSARHSSAPGSLA